MRDYGQNDGLLQALREEKTSRATLEGNIEKSINQKALMKDLLENPGFKLFQELLARQIDFRIEELTRSRPGIDGVIQNTHSIGEIAGIKLAVAFADTLIEEATDAIQINQRMIEMKAYTPETDEAESDE
jgi:hypothetical protein